MSFNNVHRQFVLVWNGLSQPLRWITLDREFKSHPHTAHFSPTHGNSFFINFCFECLFKEKETAKNIVTQHFINCFHDKFKITCDRFYVHIHIKFQKSFFDQKEKYSVRDFALSGSHPQQTGTQYPLCLTIQINCCRHSLQQDLKIPSTMVFTFLVSQSSIFLYA